MKYCKNELSIFAAYGAPYITDLNAPNVSRDIPSQTEEFQEYGRHHFVGFQPHFHINMTSQAQFGKTIKNESAISQEFHYFAGLRL